LFTYILVAVVLQLAAHILYLIQCYTESGFIVDIYIIKRRY